MWHEIRFVGRLTREFLWDRPEGKRFDTLRRLNHMRLVLQLVLGEIIKLCWIFGYRYELFDLYLSHWMLDVILEVGGLALERSRVLCVLNWFLNFCLDFLWDKLLLVSGLGLHFLWTFDIPGR